MSNDIAIQASVINEDTCQFTVDRPVYPDQSAYFASKDAAHGSPLIEKLFEIESVVAVLVSDNVVKITKKGWENWTPIAKQVGVIIRSQFLSGIPAISEVVSTNLPDEDTIRDKVRQLLKDEINPAVAAHGGYVDLINVKGNSVYLQLGGGCQGCGMADVTLRQGIEQMIRRAVPEVGEILDATDHAGGRNPYYAPEKK